MIVLNDLPYKTDKAFNALRMADTAVSVGARVSIFLLGDSVYLARKDQAPPEGSPNLEDMTLNLLEKGVEFKLCTTCVNSRGFEPKDDEVSSCFLGAKANGGLAPADIITGAQMSTMVELVNLVDTREKIVSF